jgi:hypothetical protein
MHVDAVNGRLLAMAWMGELTHHGVMLSPHGDQAALIARRLRLLPGPH